MITGEDREIYGLWRRRDSLSPAESARLESWTDPVLAAAIKSLASQ